MYSFKLYGLKIYFIQKKNTTQLWYGESINTH